MMTDDTHTHVHSCMITDDNHVHVNRKRHVTGHDESGQSERQRQWKEWLQIVVMIPVTDVSKRSRHTCRIVRLVHERTCVYTDTRAQSTHMQHLRVHARTHTHAHWPLLLRYSPAHLPLLSRPSLHPL